MPGAASGGVRGCRGQRPGVGSGHRTIRVRAPQVGGGGLFVSGTLQGLFLGPFFVFFGLILAVPEVLGADGFEK